MRRGLEDRRECDGNEGKNRCGMKRHRPISSSKPSSLGDHTDCFGTNPDPDPDPDDSACSFRDNGELPGIGLYRTARDDKHRRRNGLWCRTVGHCDHRHIHRHIHRHSNEKPNNNNDHNNNNTNSNRKSFVLAILLLAVFGIRVLYDVHYDRLTGGEIEIEIEIEIAPSPIPRAKTEERGGGLLPPPVNPTAAQNATPPPQHAHHHHHHHHHRSNPTSPTASSGGATTTTSTFQQDRYKPRTFEYWLNSTTIEGMVKNHAQPDVAWYRACALDNAAGWIQNMRSAGGKSHRFYTRACNGTGLHPQGVHWDPFHTVTHNCSVTSRVKMTVVRDHFDEDWKLTTYGADGIAKTVGGDSFYVVYSEYDNGNGNGNGNYNGNGTKHAEEGDSDSDSETPLLPLAVGIPNDYYNGTYGLDFVSVPFLDHNRSPKGPDGRRRKGRLTVYPVTTCFIGELYPPLKDGWKTGGATNVSWKIDDLERPFRVQDWYSDRYLPAQHAAQQLQQQQLNRLWDFDRVVFFGDSISQLMVWDVGAKNYHSILREKIRSGKVWVPNTGKNSAVAPDKTDKIAEQGGPVNVNLPLSPATLSEYISVLDSTVREGLLGGGSSNNDDNNNNNNDNSSSNNSTSSSSSSSQKSQKSQNNQSFALVLGSVAWDVIWPAEWQGPTFDSHLSAVTDLVKHVLSEYPSSVTVVWKLPFANHLHRADPQRCFSDPGGSSDGGACTTALRYATAERFRQVYRAQKKLFAEIFGGDPRVRVLDLYEVSYLSGAHWMMPLDSIHYQPLWNAKILDLLYQQ